ncbi:plasmalemma vesicle-associated protein [Gadus morhua]|uniref:Plasmalemma vesicle associated protein a n=1 Tax=Gadus morhua TaxID=8049 RepID=A0A8C4ZDR6_GADMO|nr:plasmalemma vesicle-associated protein-like [Gadus morhua]
MYSSSYTHVPRYSLEAQKKKQMQRSKGKSCGYYMRIIFFFSSLIQSLIIVSLVLFLVYGKKTDSPDSGRIADLEQRFSRLTLDNLALKEQRKNLTKALNVSAVERLQMDLDLGRLRNLTNLSYNYLSDMHGRLIQCETDKNKNVRTYCPQPIGTFTDRQGDCRTKLLLQEARERELQSKMNQTVLECSIKKEQLNKERDDLSLEAIDLRNDKQMLQSEITNYKLQCKQDFVASLSGISNVSRAFLEKIDSLFPGHIAFQLTCEKQRENLEQIRSNCTSLSRAVEDKFQGYLNTLGTKVTDYVGQINHLQADNQRLGKASRFCSENRTWLVQENRKDRQKDKLKCDIEVKKLLTEKKLLTGAKGLLEVKTSVKESEIHHLKEQNRLLNASCSQVNQYGRSTFGGSSSSAGNPFRIPSFGSSVGAGSTWYNNPATSGVNVGTGQGSTNLGNSKPGSSSLGSSLPFSNGVGNTRFGGTASQGSSLPLPGTGPGSSATVVGKPPTGSATSRVQGASGTGGLGTGQGSTGLGSRGFGTGQRTGLGNTGLGTGLGNTGLGTGLGNTGLGTGLGNTGLGTGLGNTGLGTGPGTWQRTGLGNTGLGTGPGTWQRTGLGNTGLGTSAMGRGTGTTGSFGGLGGGRTAGSGSLISKHLADLQLYGKPSSTEKKSESPKTSG